MQVLEQTQWKLSGKNSADKISGLILAGTAILLASETKSLLIGESANKEVVQGIRGIASSYKEIKQVNEVLTMHMGPDFILVNISVDFVDLIFTTAVEVTVAGLDRAIKQAYPHVQRIFIEIETWQTKEKPKDTDDRSATRPMSQ